MSADIITVLVILAAVIVMLITEWAPLEVLAMLVMGTLAVTGIVIFCTTASCFRN